MNITKSAPLPERPCEQLTCCEKNGSVQGNYINRVAKRHNCRITSKTKATRYGGPSTQATRYPQRMSIANNATFAAGGQCDQSGSVHCHDCNESFFLCSLRNISRANEQGANLSDSCSCAIFLRCPFSVCDGVFVNSLSFMVSTCIAMRRSYSHHGAGDGYSCSLALRRWRRLISSRIFLGKKPAGLFSGRESLLSVCFSVIHQPLGSMPRRFSSARANSLNQLPRVRPSAVAASFTCWRSSLLIRIWNVGDHPSPRGDLSRFNVDMYVRNSYYHQYYVRTLTVSATKNKAPQVSLALAGLLTTNDRKRIEVAMLNHTTHPQGRDSHNLNKYIWRFIALSTAQPRVITIEATSEQEARQQSPDGCVMVFAARIRQEVEHV
ncbi:host cell division inhibitor Icd-like protein [Escherichia coli]|uniref:host cell division inhibitor Icd-like protein n=1 Tax=Escherichia coli TaxID=562 RepID=UPI0039A41D7F